MAFPVPPKSAAEAIDGNMHETEVLDYKAQLPAKLLTKRIAGMANLHGGLIILGVKEIEGVAKPEKPVRGVSDPDGIERDLARQINAELDPNPTEIRRVEYAGKILIEIHIAKQRCVRWEGDTPCFEVRVGTTTASMKRAEIEKAYLDNGNDVVASITPVGIAIHTDGSRINLRLSINNQTDDPVKVTGVSIAIDAGFVRSAVLPIHLFRDIPGGYAKKSGSPFPFVLRPGRETTRNITAKTQAIRGHVEHVAFSGSLKLGSRKLKLPQVLAQLLNPIPQSWGGVNYNLAEIDIPKTG